NLIATERAQGWSDHGTEHVPGHGARDLVVIAAGLLGRHVAAPGVLLQQAADLIQECHRASFAVLLRRCGERWILPARLNDLALESPIDELGEERPGVRPLLADRQFDLRFDDTLQEPRAVCEAVPLRHEMLERFGRDAQRAAALVECLLDAIDLL